MQIQSKREITKYIAEDIEISFENDDNTEEDYEEVSK